MAIIYSVIKFRFYLIGSQFDIITDHKSLIFLLSSSFHSARLVRWILCLQEYDFQIKHCKGSDNLVADFFSRNFPNKPWQEHNNYLIWSCIKEMQNEGKSLPENQMSINLIAKTAMKSDFLNDIRDINIHQANDEIIKKFKGKQSNRMHFLDRKSVV